MSITLDDTTQASNPGGIIISKEKFFQYFEITGAKRALYNLIFKLSKSTLYRLFEGNNTVRAWIHTSEHLEFGCTNPSVIINPQKGLIATFTNLTSIGNKPTPVIKISREKLHLIQDKELKDGIRIASIALYYRGEPDAKAWADFDPIVPHCFCTDTRPCDKKTESIHPNAWKCLETGLHQIENKEKAGLYYITLDKQLVNSAY